MTSSPTAEIPHAALTPVDLYRVESLLCHIEQLAKAEAAEAPVALRSIAKLARLARSLTSKDLIDPADLEPLFRAIGADCEEYCHE